MIEVFIDESGNQGEHGKYFVIAAIACQEQHATHRLKRIFKDACLEYGRPKQPLKEIKSSALKFRQLQRLLNKVALRPDHEIFILVVEKKLHKSELDKNLDYMYLSGYLIKKILKKYSDDVQITFDARDVKQTSLTSIADYLKIKAYMDWGFKHKLLVRRRESHRVYCLQAADLIANVVYRNYTDDKRHLIGIIQPRIEVVIEFPQGKFGKVIP